MKNLLHLTLKSTEKKLKLLLWELPRMRSCTFIALFLNLNGRDLPQQTTYVKIVNKKEWRRRVKLSRIFKRSIFFTQSTSQFKGMKSILILWNTPLPELKCFILFTVINFKVHLFNIINIGTCTINQLVILFNQNSVSY